MDFVPLVVMVSLVKKVVDFVKYAVNGDVNAIVTQIVAWLVGIGSAFLAANSDWARSIMINGQPLSSLNAWSLVFVGVVLASVAGFGWDTVKAIDGTNSAQVPPLVPDRHTPPQP
jgi:hypothetical protein